MRHLVWLGLLVLSACALSPQQLSLQPQVVLPAAAIGGDRSVALTVNDNRATNVLGTRGGVYMDSSQITVGNDLDEAVRNAVADGLRQWQFAVADSGAAADLALTVNIDNLRYTTPDENYPNDMTMKAVISVRAERGNQFYEGRYERTGSKKYPTPPGRETNEAAVNQLLTDTLVQLFEDAKLKSFLSRS